MHSLWRASGSLCMDYSAVMRATKQMLLFHKQMDNMGAKVVAKLEENVTTKLHPNHFPAVSAYRLILSILPGAMKQQQLTDFQRVCRCSEMKRCGVLQSHMIVLWVTSLLTCQDKPNRTFCHCNQMLSFSAEVVAVRC